VQENVYDTMSNYVGAECRLWLYMLTEVDCTTSHSCVS